MQFPINVVRRKALARLGFQCWLFVSQWNSIIHSIHSSNVLSRVHFITYQYTKMLFLFNLMHYIQIHNRSVFLIIFSCFRSSVSWPLWRQFECLDEIEDIITKTVWISFTQMAFFIITAGVCRSQLQLSYHLLFLLELPLHAHLRAPATLHPPVLPYQASLALLSLHHQAYSSTIPGWISAASYVVVLVVVVIVSSVRTRQ